MGSLWRKSAPCLHQHGVLFDKHSGKLGLLDGQPVAEKSLGRADFPSAGQATSVAVLCVPSGRLLEELYYSSPPGSGVCMTKPFLTCVIPLEP